MDFLEDGDLNGIFPYDITTDPEPSQLGIGSIKQSNLPKRPQTPLPTTPAVNTAALATNNIPVSQTGLTQTEQALLSPEEQQIRLRQRGMA